MNPGIDLGAGGGLPNPAGDQTDQQVQEMINALNDPSTPPDVRQQIQGAIAMAARRQMAGIAGGGGAGPAGGLGGLAGGASSGLGGLG
jgi:hypothetical protein